MKKNNDTMFNIALKKHQAETFYKDAFCVDGEVKILPNVTGFKVTGVVELNDSKRGRFYLGRLEKKKNK